MNICVIIAILAVSRLSQAIVVYSDWNGEEMLPVDREDNNRRERLIDLANFLPEERILFNKGELKHRRPGNTFFDDILWNEGETNYGLNNPYYLGRPIKPIQRRRFTRPKGG